MFWMICQQTKEFTYNTTLLLAGPARVLLAGEEGRGVPGEGVPLRECPRVPALPRDTEHSPSAREVSG